MRHRIIGLLLLGACGKAYSPPPTPRIAEVLSGTWVVELAFDLPAGKPPERAVVALMAIAPGPKAAWVAMERQTHFGVYQLLDRGPLEERGRYPEAAGRVSGDSISVRLNPRVDHGSLDMRGRRQGDSVAGVWTLNDFVVAERGTFVMRRTTARWASPAGGPAPAGPFR